jgi:hypothetical protein
MTPRTHVVGSVAKGYNVAGRPSGAARAAGGWAAGGSGGREFYVAVKSTFVGGVLVFGTIWWLPPCFCVSYAVRPETALPV